MTAKEKGFTVYDSIFGEILLKNEELIRQSSGAVYGIFAESSSGLNNCVKPIKEKGAAKLYPVYWGSDIAPVSRVRAHVKAYKSTGNASLSNVNEIEDKKLIFGAILVSQYKKFEKHLHHNYPPLIKAERRGRMPKKVCILN